MRKDTREDSAAYSEFSQRGRRLSMQGDALFMRIFVTYIIRPGEAQTMKLFQHDYKQGKLQTQRNPVLYIFLSCFIPALIMIAALAGLHVTPFGDNSLFIADANGLYINYVSYVGRMVKGLEGFTYSFEKGLGGNMMPHMGITMLNPFFSLFTLFPIREYPAVYTLVSVLNFCLCGLTMYLLLADIYGHRRSNLIFSTAYALNGFLVANVFQVIFFTAVHVLPLVVLGLRRLLQGKSPLLYILSLTYAIATSYYMGFMICVASVLLLSLYLWLCKNELVGQKKSLFLRYALASLLGGLLAAAIWLPSLLGIKGGRLDQTQITDFSFAERFPLLEFGAKLFTGANDANELVNGRPNIYVGILPIAVVVLFFLNKEISQRRKTAVGFALGFYLLSSYIIAFDMLMHGGTTTNWFNFRYSYIFSFFLLLVAAEEWQYLDRISLADCKKCGVIMLVAIVLIFSKQYGFVHGGEVVLDFTILLIMFGAFYLYRQNPEKNPKKIFESLILLIVSFQLMLNYLISTDNLIKNNGWSKDVPEYQSVVDMVEPLIKNIQIADTDFYRMEINKQRSGNCGNDPMFYGYNGVGHGGSVERNFVRTGLTKLGVHWFDMRNYYQEGISAVTDTLLGLKYLIAQEDLSAEKGYLNMTNLNESELFQNRDYYDAYYNKYALPVAFLSGTAVETVETDFVDTFDNLNRTWIAISGQDVPVFVEENDISFRATNLFDGLEINADNARILTEKYDAEAEAAKKDPVSANKASEKKAADKTLSPEYSAYIEYTFTAKQEGPVYIYNKASMTEVQGSPTPVLEYLGSYHKGDTVTGYIPVLTDYVNRVGFEEICGRFRAAYADNDALHELATVVKERPCTVEKIKDSHLRGEFTAEDGQLLMFTIPYDEGWTCFIDGKEAEIKQVLGVFMAIDAPAGTHSYEMKFFPVGMKTGIGLSAAALLTTLVYIPLDSRRRKRADAVPETAAAPECQTP